MPPKVDAKAKARPKSKQTITADKSKSKPILKKGKDNAKGNKKEDPKKPEKKKTPRVLLVSHEAKRVYAKRLLNALQPIRILAILFGQFPMRYKEERTGTFSFRFDWYTFNGMYFGLWLCISSFALIMFTWNLFVTIVGVHEVRTVTPADLEERWLEKSLMHRHFMWVVTMGAATLQTAVAMFGLYRNRYFTPTVFTFYSKVVHQLHMDITEGAFTIPFIIILLYLSTTIGILVIGILRFAPVTIGSPTLYGVYIFRLFVINIFPPEWIDDDNNSRKFLQILGTVTLFCIFTGSKIQMFMYIYHCKLLRNGFACWNGRVYMALMKGGKYFHTDEGRTTWRLLYKDHCVMLDMLEAVNRLCAGTVEMYYALQTGTIFFECYFFLRAARYGVDFIDSAENGGKYFIRANDWIPGILLAFQSVIIALVTSKVASDVGLEAMAGLDIVRRKTMLYRKTDDELQFQLSMQASYNSFSKFDVRAGGYQYYNIDWIMGYINNVAGYFIILYQFQPFMDRSTPHEYEKRENLGIFLQHLEGLVNGHYTTTTPPPPVQYNS